MKLEDFEVSPVADRIAGTFHHTFARMAPHFEQALPDDNRFPWPYVSERNSKFLGAVVQDLLEREVIRPGADVAAGPTEACMAEGCAEQREPGWLFCSAHADELARVGGGEVRLKQEHVPESIRSVTRPCTASGCNAPARFYVTLPDDPAWGSMAGLVVQFCDEHALMARGTPGMVVVAMPETVDQALIEIERQAAHRRMMAEQHPEQDGEGP